MYYESELYHHGIKGQKWGVRRWQNADGTYNSAGKKRYFGEGSGENYKPVGSGKQSNSSAEKEHKGLTDKQKKALKIGAAVAGTALVAYGAYKLNDKVTKDLMDSYAKVANVYESTGKSYRKQGYEQLDILRSTIPTVDKRNSNSEKLIRDMNFVANDRLNRGQNSLDESYRLRDKANSGFSIKERVDAAKTIITKGSDEFKKMKISEIDRDSWERVKKNNRIYDSVLRQQRFNDTRF